jgi:electron transfer flavoprotein beta subunit
VKILIPIQVVPDPVEEIVINKTGSNFDLAEIAWILNEFDDHAIEEGILLKEKFGAEVLIVAAGGEPAEDGLFAAAAKGADRLIKLSMDFRDNEVNNHALAKAFFTVIDAEKPDLVLTGVSNPNGFDGPLGALLAEQMGVPYVGYVSGVEVTGSTVVAFKDYPGGVKAKLEVELPVVLGISSAHEPPRYVPISKVRQAMKTTPVEDLDVEVDLAGGLSSDRMYTPEVTGRAEMLTGNLKEIADRIAEIIKSQGLI